MNSLQEVLPHFLYVHAVVAQLVENLRGGGLEAGPLSVAAAIKGATHEKVRPFLHELYDWGVIEREDEKGKGYWVTGFGVEVLVASRFDFFPAQSEIQRRLDDAALRLEVLG